MLFMRTPTMLHVKSTSIFEWLFEADAGLEDFETNIALASAFITKVCDAFHAYAHNVACQIDFNIRMAF